MIKLTWERNNADHQIKEKCSHVWLCRLHCRSAFPTSSCRFSLTTSSFCFSGLPGLSVPCFLTPQGPSALTYNGPLPLTPARAPSVPYTKHLRWALQSLWVAWFPCSTSLVSTALKQNHLSDLTFSPLSEEQTSCQPPPPPCCFSLPPHSLVILYVSVCACCVSVRS